MIFKDLGFEPQLQEGLDMMGFEKPTPIQEQAIPAILNNKDMIACAQTGTGKTAAFVLPILNKLCKGNASKINTIIISPTRELALQIDRQIGVLATLQMRHHFLFTEEEQDQILTHKKMPSKMVLTY